MIIHLDNVSKESIIGYILPLSNKLKNDTKNIKFKIKISIGKVLNIDDGRVAVSNKNCYYDLSIKTLLKEDLIIILRYLQNMEKCYQIITNNMKYGEILDLRKRTWKRIPSNQKEVNEKLKEYLSKKKNFAVINFYGK